MMKAVLTILLLVTSNIFMTFAWYGHLKLQEMKISTGWPLILVILLSWGFGVLRVLRPSAGQQNRFPGKRRPVQYHAAESHPGSDIIDSFHNRCHFSFQGTASPMEPFGGVCLPDSGSFLRFYQIIHTFLKNFAEKFGM